MLKKVYIRTKEIDCQTRLPNIMMDGWVLPDNINCYTALDGFRKMGVEVAPFYGFGDIQEIDDLGPEVGIHGFVGDIHEALKKINKPIPAAIDYPECLQRYLGRTIGKCTIDEIKRIGGSRFIKPVKHKLFTGFVYTGTMHDKIRLSPYEDSEEIWYSEVVEFVSEWRVFCLLDSIIDIRNYKGRFDHFPNMTRIRHAWSAYVEGGYDREGQMAAPDACAMDFGVTKDGQTLLIEVNDAFALGCYGLDSIEYANMISYRWEQLTK